MGSQNSEVDNILLCRLVPYSGKCVTSYKLCATESEVPKAMV